MKSSNAKGKFFFGKESINFKRKCRRHLTLMLDSQKLKNLPRNYIEWNSSTKACWKPKKKSTQKCWELSTKSRTLNWSIRQLLRRNHKKSKSSLKLQSSWRSPSKELARMRVKSWRAYRRQKEFWLRKRQTWSTLLKLWIRRMTNIKDCR